MSDSSSLGASLTKRVRSAQELAESDPELVAYPVRFISEKDELFEGEILNQLQELNEEDRFTPNRLYDIFRLYDGITAFDFAMILKVLLDEFSNEEAMKIINGFGKISGESSVLNLTNVDQLEDQFQVWKVQLQQELQHEIQDADRLEDLVEMLDEPVQRSPVRITRFRIRALITWNGTIINTEQGPELLDRLKISPDTPFVVYTPVDSSFEPIYKVFTDPSTEKSLDYSIITQNPTDPNILLLTVWTGEDRTRITSDSIQFVQIDMFRGTLTLLTDLPNDRALELLVQRLSEALPSGVSIQNLEKTMISASLDIYNLKFDVPSFLELVGTAEIYSLLISFREQSNKPYGFRSKMTFDYHETRTVQIRRGGYIKSSSDLKFVIDPQFVSGTMEVQTSDEEVLTLNRNDSVLSIRVTKARDQKTLDRFLEVFPRLMKFYNSPDEIDAVREEYRLIFGNSYSQLIPSPEKTSPESSKKDPTRVRSKIEVLQTEAGDMFRQGQFSRQCNKPRQPYWISSQRAAEIREEGSTFTMAGQEVEVQVLEFPPDLPQFEGKEKQYFICAQPGSNLGSKDYPFPGLIDVNPAYDVHSEYPVLPCCFQGDQRMDRNVYTRVYTDGTLSKGERGGGRGKNVIKTNKILVPEGLGLVNPVITSILQWSTSNTKVDFKRLGVPNRAGETNALIHCVLRAVQNEFYMNLPDDKTKFDYVRRIRTEVLPRFVVASVLKQELWNYTSDEIMELLTNNEVYFDSKIFVRALEEAFQVNIFVFHEWSIGKSQGKTQKVQLEIPQSRMAHLSTPKNRQCVLVLRHRGGESDGLLRDHYELIVKTQTGRAEDVTTLYDNSMNQLMQTLNRMNSINLEWSFVEDEMRVQDAYGKFDPEAIFNRSDQFHITGQILDSYGKLRGVAIGNMKVFFLPSQPLNVVEVSAEVSDPPTAKTVMEIFGPPSRYNSENRQMVGLWFPLLDLVQGLYVPIQPEQRLPGVKLGDPHPLITSGENQSERIQILKSTSEMIRKIFLSIYVLFPGSYDLDRVQRKSNVQEFMKQYTVVGNQTQVDTSTIYQLENVPNKLTGDLDRALAQLEQGAPSLVRNGKIYLFSPLFAREIQFLLEHQGPRLQTMVLKIPYSKESDFEPMLFTRIIFGSAQYREWLESLKDTEQTIRKTLTMEDRENLSPFPVMTVASSEQQIFLLQNAIDHTLETSLGIGHIWRTELVNPGPVPDEGFEDYPHVIYGLDPSGNLIPIADNTQGKRKFIDVIHWGGDMYGALLPLAH